MSVSELSSNAQLSSGSTIISVELGDNSSFKFPLTYSTTPKILLSSVARKVGISQIGFFGLQCVKSILVQYEFGGPPVPTGSKTSVSSSTSSQYDGEEKVFLLDEVPILDQVIFIQKAKLYVAMKYSFEDPRKELEDQTTLNFLYQEFAKRFRMVNCESVSRDVLLNLLALQIHCKHQLSAGPSFSFLEDAKNLMPKNNLTGTTLDQFIEEALRATKSLSTSNVSYKDGVRRFLHLIKQTFPEWFTSTFECVHAENNAPMIFKIGSEGIHLVSEKSHDVLYIPYKVLSGWTFVQVEDEATKNNPLSRKSNAVPFIASSSDDDKSIHKSAEKLSFSSQQSLALEAANMVNQKTDGKRHTLSAKSKFGTVKKMSNKFSIDLANGLKDRPFKYLLNLHFTDSSVGSLQFLVFSQFSGDDRLLEYLNAYSSRFDSKDDDFDNEYLDDPNDSDTPIICIAKCDHAAKSPDELMFLTGDEIKVLKKIGNGFYMGECQSFQGTFKGSMVTFKKRDKGSSSSLARKSEGLKANTKQGEVIHVYMLDDTRRSFMITSHTTGQQLVQLVVDKLELSESDLFGICEVKDNSERWIIPRIPLSRQNVTANSKLVFKSRLLYLDVSELTDPKITYLYYIQVKKYILGGTVQLGENEVIDFASLQLQATFGDFDPEKHKPGYLTSLNDYLPPYFMKMTMTKNENWWQKKFFAAHQQHKGLSKSDAEKAYIASAQRLATYGFELFYSIIPDNFLLGISRDHVALIEKNTKNVTEKLVLDFTSVKYKNNSLSIRSFSLQTLEILRLLNLLHDAELKAKLRRKCKTIREKFGLLSTSFDLLESDGLLRPQDPEDLFQCLKNGVALRNLIHSLSRLDETLNHEIAHEYTGGHFPSSDLPAYLAVENVQAFLQYCKETLKLSENSLFSPEELNNFSLISFSKVCDTILQVLQSGVIPAKIQEIQDKLKAAKVRTKTSSTTGGQPAMTTEDFMRKVLDEIVFTEQNYARDLQNIVQQHVSPLKALSGQPYASEFLEMFGNVESLSQFHQGLVQDLEKNSKDIKSVGVVGKLFYDNGDRFIPLYEQYCLNHAEPAERLPADIKASAEVMAAIGFSGDPQKDQNAKHALSSKLIKPVQRIMRYHLLLKELVRYTPEQFPGYGELERGLQKMKDVAQSVNEIKRKRENERTLNMLQSKMEGYEGPPMQHFGALLNDGKMVMVEKSFMLSKSKFGNSAASKDVSFTFFLFDEALIFCKETKKPKTTSTSYRFKGAIPISQISTKERVQDAGESDEMKFAWELFRSDLQKTYVMTCLNYEDKERWLSAIEDLRSRPPRKDKVEIDWKKLRSVESFAQQDSSVSVASGTVIRSKLTNTVRKLGGWRRENTSETLVSESPDSPSSTSQAQLPLVTQSQSSVQLSKQPSVSFKQSPLENSTELTGLSRQVDELSAVVKKLIDDNKSLQAELLSEREKARKLEAELSLEKGKNIAYESVANLSQRPSGGQKDLELNQQVLKQLEMESRARSEFQNHLKSLNVLLETLKMDGGPQK